MGVGVELALGNALQADVRLEFGMELLAGAVGMVELDHLLGRQGQGGPKAFQLVLGKQQGLLAVPGGAGDQRDPAHGTPVGKRVAFVDQHGELARAGSEVGLLGAQGKPQPERVCTARIPAADEIELLVQAGGERFLGIMGPIQAGQQPRLRGYEALRQRRA